MKAKVIKIILPLEISDETVDALVSLFYDILEIDFEIEGITINAPVEEEVGNEN